MAVSARKRIWGWYFFDWASQPYNTLLLTFIFAPYFGEVARAHFAAIGMGAEAAGAAAQAYWGTGLTIAGVLIAVLAPILGAIADQSGRRMVWIWFFSACYVTGAWGLWFLVPDAGGLFWPVAFFGLGLIGMEFATIFTNALLPALGHHDEIGGISGSGFAFGYLGGVVALVLMLTLLAESGAGGKTLIGIAPILGLDPGLREGTRAVGPFSAIWYAVFMVPFFLWVREPKVARRRLDIGAALGDLWRLLRSLPHRPSLAAYLGSAMLYRDALNGLFGFGGIYAGGVLGWSILQIGVFGIIGAVAAMVASWIGGRADRAYGPKPVIIVSIVVLIAVCVIIVGLTRDGIWGVGFAEGSSLPDRIFYLCGALIGGAGGSLQASSRTMMVRHTSPERATEAFGLYALSGKATAFLAPAMIALVTALTGNQRWGVSPLIVLFGIGLMLMIRVRAQGEREG